MMILESTMMRCQRRGLSLALLAVLFAGCGGGEGDTVRVAAGQDSDPVVVDVPIAYIKRPIPVDDDGATMGSDARELITFAAGGDVFLRDRASPSAQEVNITGQITGGEADVKDLEVSFDGGKLLFALRLPLLEDVDDEDQPTWNIWEYEIATAILRRIIASDLTAAAGHDVAPAYLPDGRIVFSSTRQRTMRAILLDEGKPQYAAQDEDDNEPAFLLHVMRDDGSELEQISFNQSHDLDPTVMDDGRIVFSRWDNAGGNDGMHLYQSSPDGYGLSLLYGANSHATGSDGSEAHFLQPREMPDGGILSLLRPFQATDFGGDLVVIDADNYVEITQPVADNAGGQGPAQLPATANAVRTDDLPSRGGRYSSAFPLWDGTDRLFVAWSECRLQDQLRILPCTEAGLADPALAAADPLYGIWVYDRTDDTQLPVVPAQEGFMIGEVVATQPRANPPVIFPDLTADQFDPDAAAENVGILNIRSVYDIDGVDTSPAGISVTADPAARTAAQRPARFLRISKIVSQPPEDVRDVPRFAFGSNRGIGMREIIGYAPIEPDGSVLIKVPANVALDIGVLDGRGRRRAPRHNAWLQVRPGEMLRCNGCHERDAPSSHGRPGTFASVHAGAPTTAQPYPNTNPALFADFGETMAEVRARISCGSDCAALSPTVDLEYEDVWTDAVAAGRAPDVPFAWRYADLETPAPATQACQDEWDALCRVVINYEAHIHPLWSLDRVTYDTDNVTVLSDHTCTTCHNVVDDMGQARVPAGQLDLSDGPSDQTANQFKAYRELYFRDNEQELNMGMLRDRQIEVGIDPDTMLPILAFVPVAPSMRSCCASSSRLFFDRFATGGSHAGYLSGAELKLLSEWSDLGGQYYNNPFDAPEN